MSKRQAEPDDGQMDLPIGRQRSRLTLSSMDKVRAGIETQISAIKSDLIECSLQQRLITEKTNHLYAQQTKLENLLDTIPKRKRNAR